MAKITGNKEKNNLPEGLDRTDWQVLKLLQQNARITVKEIAESVNLSTTPVHDRVKRLERDGYIKQYATLVDPAKVGKGLMVICYVSLKEHSKTAGSKFIRSIHQLNEVVECFNISGSFDFMLKVVANDMDSYYDFHVNKLSLIENMGQIQSVFVMGVIKQSHQLVW
jgi:Lrp/AsnC family leucine-responsive transcriptional regulator